MKSEIKTIASRALMLLLVAMSVVSAAQAQSAASGESETVLLSRAEFILSNQMSPPSDSADWREVVLPDGDSLREVAADALGWYRIPISAPQDVDEKLAVYLWRYGMNAAVYLNGHLLGDGGSITNDRIRNTHQPLLFVLPPGSYVAEQNYIYVHLKGVGGFARLMPPAFGNYEYLRGQYEWRVFTQQKLPMVLLAVVLLMGSLSFIYSLSDVSNRGYSFLGLACVAWLPFSLNPIIHEVPISMDFWRWSMHAGIDAFGISLVFFAHRLVGVKRPKIEFGLLAALLITCTLYATWSDRLFGLYATATHLLTIILGCYTGTVLYNGYRRTRELTALVFMLGIVMLLPLGLHDVLFSSLPLEQSWTYSFLASNLGAPALFLALGLDLTWSVYRSNARLHQALELERFAREERSRIYSDVHDDVGARLLSLIYNAENEQQEQTARSALDDMRAAIQNNTQPIGIVEFVEQWHNEVAERCGEASIELDWQEEIGQGHLTAEMRYQLTKVLRETLSNVLRHSKATQLKIRTQTTGLAESLEIVLEDDGIGFDPDKQSSGTGLSSIRQRLNRIAGSMQWNREGRRVDFALPIKPSA